MTGPVVYTVRDGDWLITRFHIRTIPFGILFQRVDPFQTRAGGQWSDFISLHRVRQTCRGWRRSSLASS